MIEMPNQILAIFPKKVTPIIEYTQSNILNVAGINIDVTKEQVPWGDLVREYGTGKHGGIYIGFKENGSLREDNSPTWQEINFGSRNPFIVVEGLEARVIFDGHPLDSYTIQAQRRGKVSATDKDIIENAIQLFLIKDGEFLIQRRGGQDQPGKANVSSGGSVTYIIDGHYVDNPITDTVHGEAIGETGSKIFNVYFLGLFNQRGVHTNRQSVFKAEPEKELDTIIANHREAIKLYRQVKERTGDELAARTELKESEYANDFWESSELMCAPFTAESFLRIMHDQKYKGAELIGSFTPTLFIVGTNEWGMDFAKEANKLEIVQNEIILPNRELVLA